MTKADVPSVRKKIPFQAMIDEDAVVLALDSIDVEMLLGALRMAKIAREGARLFGVGVVTPDVDAQEEKLVALLAAALKN